MFERESFRPLNCMRNYFFCETSIKLLIMRTILWIIKLSVIVHLCVENSFSWWNSLFLFSNLKYHIDWYIEHTKYFWRVPCGIHSGLLCYHKKQSQQLLKTAFVTIATKPLGPENVFEQPKAAHCFPFYLGEKLKKKNLSRIRLGPSIFLKNRSTFTAHVRISLQALTEI